MTLDIFFPSEDTYARVAASGALTKSSVAELYCVEPDDVLIFELPNLNALKVSFPRRIVAGSFEDTDLHAGQQHVLLSDLRIPVGVP